MKDEIKRLEEMATNIENQGNIAIDSAWLLDALKIIRKLGADLEKANNRLLELLKEKLAHIVAEEKRNEVIEKQIVLLQMELRRNEELRKTLFEE